MLLTSLILIYPLSNQWRVYGLHPKVQTRLGRTSINQPLDEDPLYLQLQSPFHMDQFYDREHASKSG